MESIWLMPLAAGSLALTAAAAPVASAFPTAASPVAAALRDRIVAEAAAVPPERLVFERETVAARSGGGTITNTRTTDRWSGRRWTLVTIHGRQPSTRERADHMRTATAIPVPGYYQLGAIVAAATGTSVDAQGRTVLLIPVMPANSVRTDTGDISANLQGEARLARSGDAVWVDQLHVTSRLPFKLTMLIKVIAFDQTSEYAAGPDGRPRLTGQASESRGAMFGFPGGEKSRSSFVYR